MGQDAGSDPRLHSGSAHVVFRLVSRAPAYLDTSDEKSGLARPTAGLALGQRGRLSLLAPGDFVAAELRDLSDQLRGNRLREREAECAPCDLVAGKSVPECRDEALGGGVERIVLLPPSEIKLGGCGGEKPTGTVLVLTARAQFSRN